MARAVTHYIADILEAIAVVDTATYQKTLEDYHNDSILRFAI